MNKFNKGDRVGTNIHYLQGWADLPAPAGTMLEGRLQRLTDLEVVKVIFLGKTDTDSKYTEPYIYECRSKTKSYLINQCFLEQN
jgi:hypothetical protein